MGITSDLRRGNLPTSTHPRIKQVHRTGLVTEREKKKKVATEDANPRWQGPTQPQQRAAVAGLYDLLIPKSPNSNIPNKEMIRGFHPTSRTQLLYCLPLPPQIKSNAHTPPTIGSSPSMPHVPRGWKPKSKPKRKRRRRRPCVSSSSPRGNGSRGRRQANGGRICADPRRIYLAASALTGRVRRETRDPSLHGLTGEALHPRGGADWARRARVVVVDSRWVRRCARDPGRGSRAGGD